MKIGIIGTGNIGKTLVCKLAKAGHYIQMANSRGPETLKELAEETGAKALTTKEAIQGVDVIILSIPLNQIPHMKELLAGVPDDVTVIDTSNYYPQRDGKIVAIEEGQIESLWVKDQLGHPIVKAWNSIGADSFANKGTASGSPNRIALPVAADREKDRKIGMTLVEETGFDAFDAGTLSESWKQQPGAPCYCTDLTKKELPSALTATDAARLPKRRDLSLAVIQERVGDISTANLAGDYFVRLNRALFT